MGERRFGLGGFLLIASIVVPAAVLPLHAATKRPFIQKRYLRVISGGSVSVTFKKPNAAGNLIVAYVVWDNAGTASITDTAGNAYDSAIGPTQATGDTSSAQVFYARNIAGGPNTVTATFATGITARGVLYVLSMRDSIAPIRSTARWRRRDRLSPWTAATSPPHPPATCSSRRASRTENPSDG